MVKNAKNLIRMRTWFGCIAVIETSNRYLHRAGVGRMLIPHPPVINWLLRFRMGNDFYYKLSVIHEFGHFQTLPVIAVYLIIVVCWILITQKGSFIGLTAILVSIHATWEILAELFVRYHSGSLYSRSYNGISVIPRIIFWSVSVAISIGGLTIFLY